MQSFNTCESPTDSLEGKGKGVSHMILQSTGINMFYMSHVQVPKRDVPQVWLCIKNLSEGKSVSVCLTDMKP